MKKILIVVCCAVLIVVCCLGIRPQQTVCAEEKINDCLRIHIRANSNLNIDQKIKFCVKDKVVEFLSPLLKNVNSVETAKNIVLSQSKNIEKIANCVLNENGFLYSSKVYLNSEYFPDRSYGEQVFRAGIYDALIVELGSGEGNNWWCVVFPPLCFINSEENSGNQIKYKSKLFELINEKN